MLPHQLRENEMTFNGFLQLAVYFLYCWQEARPLGVYMTRVFSGERTLMSRVLGPVWN
jgi:K+-transporting ATPase ATPase A chain